MTAPAGGRAELDEASVVGYLRGRGVLPPRRPGAAEPAVRCLAGGVSGVALLVVAGGRRLVVKQPRALLAVSDRWPARLERAETEAAALRVFGGLTPAHVPALLDADPAAHVLTMAAAPAGWANWRDRLLAGEVDAATSALLGRLLAGWHAGTQAAEHPGLAADFGDLGGFVELRGAPYHETVAARRGSVAAPVLACLDELLGTQACLVHGDFSPKNVLLAPAAGGGAAVGFWVLDHEVAHLGNPVFDVAFCLHHLAMKVVHVPAAAAALGRCAADFVAAYQAGIRQPANGAEPAAATEPTVAPPAAPVAGGVPATPAPGWAPAERAVVRHTGALLLARVHGKSPAGYLTPSERDVVSALGTRAVRGELPDVPALFAAATAAAPVPGTAR